MAVVLLDRLLEAAARAGATDILLRAGKPPTLRVDTRLRALDSPPSNARELEEFLNDITPGPLRANLPSDSATTFGRDQADGVRLRVIATPCETGWSINIRRHPATVRSMTDAGLPPIMQSLVRRPRGLLLISGPPGSGRTTLMRTMLDYLSRAVGDRSIVTLEQPIELRLAPDKVRLEQREVGVHVPTVAAGIHDARRGGANVIAIGDLHEPDDILAATDASLDGVLILAAAAGLGAANALGNLLIALHEAGVPQPALVLSNSVLGVLSAVLCPKTAGGLVPAYELALSTPEISQMVARSRLTELDAIISSDTKHGMQLLDNQLFALWRDGVVGEAQVVEHARFPNELQTRIERAKRAGDGTPPTLGGLGPQPQPNPTPPPSPGLESDDDPAYDN